MFAIILMGKVLGSVFLQDCICFSFLFFGFCFCFWVKSIYLLAGGCLNWCLAEHSPVKYADTTSLVCPFLTRLLSLLKPQEYRSLPVLARMFTMSSFLCV